MKREDFSRKELIAARRKYHMQKTMCRVRTDKGKPVKMKLTFEEWLDFWLASGHWEERGRNKNQYQMSRTNDTGDYELGNIKIITGEENRREIEHTPVLKVTQRVTKGKNTFKPLRCTVDNITIYPSVRALKTALGEGSKGLLNPNFRFVD